jgi:two-component system chemotaxis response regulator CheB
LKAAVPHLPADLEAAVFVVLHQTPMSRSRLPTVLQRYTDLKVSAARDGEAIERARVYVAPPDHRLLLRPGTMHLSRGPKENGHRPAIDSLIRAAARAYGPRVVGVVFSGTLDDGALGLRMIASSGGAAVVQDPEGAAFPGMPQNALAAIPDAVRAPAGRLGAIIGEISRSPFPEEGAITMADDASLVYENDDPEDWRKNERAVPSVFTNPNCSGTDRNAAVLKQILQSGETARDELG